MYFVLLTVTLNGYCQAGETPAQKIRRLEDQERTAEMNQDTALLFRLWSPDYVVNNAGNFVLNAAQLKTYIRQGGIDAGSFTRNIERITFIKDIAVVMGAETVAAKNKSDNAGKPITRRFTNIWIKSDTSWQLSARQASNVMVMR